MSQEANPTLNITAVKGALLRYRIMAYVVGALLVVLVLVGMPLKYLGHNDIVVTATGIPHGWLYMVLLVTAYDLGRRVNWPWSRMLWIMVAGTIPFVTFIAEHYATKDVQRRIAEAEVNAAGDTQDDSHTSAS